MQIQFEKVATTPKDFELEYGDILFRGILQKTGYSSVLLDAEIQGDLLLICDRCGCDYSQKLDTELKLTISNKISENKDDLDIIEFLDGVIDLDYTLESELNALRGEYHHCNKCSNSDKDFEFEL